MRIMDEISEAELSATRRLVNGFSAIPQQWAQLAAEHLDGDECVAMPMWGTLFRVTDSCDLRGIRSLLTPICPPDEHIAAAREELREDCHICGGTGADIAYTDDDCPECGGIGIESFDDDEVADRARELWAEDCDEREMLASSGWEEVGKTGILAREIHGELLLGFHGCGYDFYSSHWVPLYRALGYRWHE